MQNKRKQAFEIEPYDRLKNRVETEARKGGAAPRGFS